MIGKTVLGLAVIIVGTTAIPALAESEPFLSPLKQFNSGVPLHMIECSKDTVLMKSPSDTPACLTQNSSAVLAGRGYSFVIYDHRTELKPDTDTVNNGKGPLRAPFDVPLSRGVDNPSEILRQDLSTLIDMKNSAREEGGGFDPLDWIPERVPDRYVLVHTLHGWHGEEDGREHGLDMYFAPSDFGFTNSTRPVALRDAGGIILSIYQNKYLEYGTLEGMEYHVSIGMDVFEQSNGLYGYMKQDDGHRDFNGIISFPDYVISPESSSLTRQEGIDLLNSIKGDLIPPGIR